MDGRNNNREGSRLSILNNWTHKELGHTARGTCSGESMLHLADRSGDGRREMLKMSEAEQPISRHRHIISTCSYTLMYGWIQPAYRYIYR